MPFLIFLREFVAVPAFLVGIFTLIGALIQRKKVSQTIVSVFKVIVGFLILGGGAGVLVGSLNTFQPLFQATYNLTGVIPNNDAFAGVLTKGLPSIVSLGSTIMVLAMIANLILAAFSRYKYVYLSGHVLFYSSLMLAAVMYTIGMDFDNNAGDYALALFSGVAILASYMVLSPATQQRYMRQITGTDEIGLGHTGGFGYALSGLIGEGISKISKKRIISTEEIKFPQSLFFFRNTLVSISLTVFVFYLFAFLPSGIIYSLGKMVNEKGEVLARYKEAHSILSNGNWGVTMLVQTFTFTAGVEIILVGVRLFVGELVPMFKGISDKFIKNSKAAVDCPVVFPYAPNAVIIGFISSFVGGILGMFITIGLHSGALLTAVILPGLVPHFFLGATAGVFGNVKGGILGAIIGPFIMGIFITFVPAIFLWGGWVPGSNSALANLAKGNNNLTALNWGDTDYIIGAWPGLFGKGGKILGAVASILVYVFILLDGIFMRFIPNYPGHKKYRAWKDEQIKMKKEKQALKEGK